VEGVWGVLAVHPSTTTERRRSERLMESPVVADSLRFLLTSEAVQLCCWRSRSAVREFTGTL
jgi:hypothetical protein